MLKSNLFFLKNEKWLVDSFLYNFEILRAESAAEIYFRSHLQIATFPSNFWQTRPSYNAWGINKLCKQLKDENKFVLKSVIVLNSFFHLFAVCAFCYLTSYVLPKRENMWFGIQKFLFSRRTLDCYVTFPGFGNFNL